MQVGKEEGYRGGKKKDSSTSLYRNIAFHTCLSFSFSETSKCKYPGGAVEELDCEVRESRENSEQMERRRVERRRDEYRKR